MTSEERHEARYQRRKAAREEKRRQATAEFDDFDKVFTYEHLYRSYQKCRKGVSWKASVQRYNAIAPLNVAKTLDALQSGKYKSTGFYEFDICERGKKRHIRSVRFEERVVQRCLCDYSLTPMLGRSLIYDNGASTRGKGYTFAVNRACKHLRDFASQNGDGYVLLFDFSKFFDNIDHEYIKAMLAATYTDERLLRLIYHFIDMFGTKGLGLGSQISQTLALSAPNAIDHHFKDVRGVKSYARYMDDGMMFGTKEELKAALAELDGLCEQYRIALNRKKTQIVKISHGFTWLHVQFHIEPTGKIVRTMGRASVTRCRRKLRDFRQRVDDGKMTVDNVGDSLQSWLAYAKTFSSYETRQRMINQFNSLFYGGNLK